MPGPLKRVLVRRILALAIASALILDMSIFAVVGYAHITRTRVTIELRGEHEIVQVFVNCKLAYFRRTDGAFKHAVDLGWLAKEDVLTFQVRSQKRSGHLKLSFLHDGQRTLVFQRGSSAHLLLLGAGRVDVANSWTVGGRRIGSQGCQADAPQRLAFATASAGPWKHSSAPFGLAEALAGVIPWVLAIMGASVVVAGAIVDRTKVDRSTLGVLARSVVALAGISVAMVWAVATQSFSLAFGLCVAVGVVSLLATIAWLLGDDLRRLAAFWASR